MSYQPDTKAELYSLAQISGMTGYSDMSKDELFEALQNNAPHLLEPFQDVDTLEVGDHVQMSHISSDLIVEEDGLGFYTDDDENKLARYVTMFTTRGGRHQLVIPEPGVEFGKNGEDPHLRRWRAGDEEWMNNSRDPVYLIKVTEEEEETDEEEENPEEGAESEEE